jgi:periplasmic protein TonB
MAANANIFFERDGWKAPLGSSAGLHLALFVVIVVYSAFNSRPGESWGGGDIGSAMGATLVSRAAVPLPAPEVQTNNVLANQSKGLSQSLPKQAEQVLDALPIPAQETKPKPQPKNSRITPKTPPPEDNTVPYGEGGPVSAPYTTFTSANTQGGLSFGENGQFGKMYGWYVDVVRRKVSENWLKYEVDPSITSARRVYLTFDITRTGEPSNVQVEQSSGVPSLDQSAVRALQRIDSFGPLPAGYPGSKVSVEFWFDYKR